MKSLFEVRAKLLKEWERAEKRQDLFSGTWPRSIALAKPSSKEILSDTQRVARCLREFSEIKYGKVEYEEKRFRHLSDGLSYPTSWEFDSLETYILGLGSRSIELEYERLKKAIRSCDPMFAPVLIKQKQIVLNSSSDDIAKASEVALLLEEGAYEGMPLRAIYIGNIDTKFLERNRKLMAAFLGERFQVQLLPSGLENFLGCDKGEDHWLTVADLSGDILPLSVIKARDSELAQRPLGGRLCLIVENLQSIHQLPRIKGAIAILGAGRNLSWLSGGAFDEKAIGYWGDLDSWGLHLLSLARKARPELSPIMMTRAVFDRFSEGLSVREEDSFSKDRVSGLTPEELELFDHLIALDKGRLEQEFLPKDFCAGEITRWAEGI